jgi:hypothetical protein
MKTSDFSRIRFFPQYRTPPKRFNPSCEAFDTETQKGDIRVLACSHEGIECEHTIDALNFIHANAKSINFLYNLDYDVSAIMKQYIVETGLAEKSNGFIKWDVGKYRIEYLPGKHFTIKDTQRRIYRRMYDLAQFYGFTPLAKASLQFLNRELSGEMKADRARLFETHSLVDIIKYCIEDSRATKDLGEKFIEENIKLGVKSDRYYSTASLAQKAFMVHSDYPEQRHTWRGIHRMAFYAYKGGWFDMYMRGHFESAHAYDIVSAYPAAMRNLPDIRDGRWVPYLDKEAELGFIKCRVKADCRMTEALPLSIKSEGRNLYPFFTDPFDYTLTLPEYRALRGSYSFDIQGAVSFIPSENARRPFRPFVDKFFEIKRKAKGIPRMNAKIYLNSLYGKTVQLVPFKGNFRTSTLTNFIYGSHITSDCRMKVFEASKGAEVIQILTDSLITKDPLKLDFGSELGQWEEKFSGAELLSVKCGIYSFKNGGEWVNAETHTRGFSRKNTLADMLAGDMNAHENRPWKIRSAMIQGKSSRIASFQSFVKKISLIETKRMFKGVKPSELLEMEQDSVPIPSCLLDAQNNISIL